MKRSLLLLTALFLFTEFSAAQVVNTSGKEYYVTLGNGSWAPIKFSIASKHNATVDFHFAADASLDETFTIPANTVLFVDYDYTDIGAITNTSTGTIENKSLHILADSNIVLHMVSNASANQDATLIHPVYCQSEQDSIVFFPISPHVSFATENGFALVGQCGTTMLEIIPKEDVGSYTAGVPFTITLNEGATFWIANADGLDQTGTKIKVTDAECPNPVNIITSNELNFITYPAGGDATTHCCADLTIEQNQQVGWWDTLYHFVPFYNLPELGIVRLISASDNNQVYFDGVPVKTLSTGIPWDTLLTVPVVIRTDYNIGMSQIMLSHPLDEVSVYYVPGDPAQLWAPPLKYGIRESIFKAIPYIYMSEYDTAKTILTLIARAPSPATLLNGMDISSAYIPFPGDAGYMYQLVLLDTGTVYHLEAETPVVAYMTRLSHCGSLLYALGDTKVMPTAIRDTLQGMADTLYLCGQDALMLDGGEADEYFWSTGAVSRSVEVAAIGEYKVYTSVWEEGCFKDLVMHTFLVLDAWYEPELGEDTLVCGKGPLVLDPGVVADTYLWQDGANESTCYAYESGKYWVTTNKDNCLSSDTINVTFVDLIAYLGEDIPVCQGEKIAITLDVSLIPGATALWNTGASGASIQVFDTGIYNVLVTYPPCNAADSIVIFAEMCDCNVMVPSVFSPNNDGINDVFQPSTEDGCLVTDYGLSVFNRWGQRVFHSSNINNGWDGTFQGAVCDLGTYFYYIEMKTGTQYHSKTYKGDITLLR